MFGFGLERLLFCACVSPCIYVYLRTLCSYVCECECVCARIFCLLFPVCPESLPPSLPLPTALHCPLRRRRCQLSFLFRWQASLAVLRGAHVQFPSFPLPGFTVLVFVVYVWMCAPYAAAHSTTLPPPRLSLLSLTHIRAHVHTRDKEDEGPYRIPVKVQRRCCGHVHSRVGGGKTHK